MRRAPIASYDYFIVRTQIAILAAAVATTSCASPMSQLRTENKRLSGELDELREDHREQDRRIRDLEHRLTERQVRDQSAHAPSAGVQAGTAVPVLPVVVVAPDEQGPESALEPDARVVGVADDGAEVVYVGEAAATSHEWVDDLDTPPPAPARGRAMASDVADVAPHAVRAKVKAHAEPAEIDMEDDPSVAESIRVTKPIKSVTYSIDTTSDLALMDPAAPAVEDAPAKNEHRNPFAFGRSRHTRMRDTQVAVTASAATTDNLGVTDTIAANPTNPGMRATDDTSLSEHHYARRHHAHGRVAASEASASPSADYRAAVALVKAGKHHEGQVALRAFIKAHPRHDYADNAQYWLGEDYYLQKDYAHALAEFRATIDKYPRGNKVPDAFLKVGDCYRELGEADASRDALHDLVARFPRSESAAIATRRLEVR